MAGEKSIDELDEELEELEKELAALEEGDLPEEEPEDPDAEQEPEQEEGSGGLMGKLPFGKGKKKRSEEPEEDEAADEDEPAPVEEAEPPQGPDEEEDSSRFSGLISRFQPDKEAEEAPGEAEEAKAPDPTEPPEPQAAEQPEQEEEEEEEQASRFGGLMGRLTGGSKAEEDEPPEEPEDPEPELGAEETPPPPDEEIPQEDGAEQEPAVAAAGEGKQGTEPTRRLPASRREWEREQGAWRRRTPEETEALPEEEDEEGTGGARALLARFRGKEEEEEIETEPYHGHVPEPPSPADEHLEAGEEEGRRAVPLWLLWILAGIIVVALIAAAVVLLGGDDGGLGGASAPTAAATVAGGSPAPGGGFVAVVGQAITLDASGTTGDVTEYQWDFGDGESETTTEPTVSHVYASSGSFTAVLTAVNDGAEDTAEIQIQAVQAPEATAQVLVNGEPAAEPGSVGNNAFVGAPVALDGSGSTADPELSLAGFTWDVDGDGASDAEGETVEVTFDTPGMWVVNLTVTDELGNTAEASQMVHVGSAFNITGTAGQALGSDEVNEHPFGVPEGRLGATPVQVMAVLTYTPPQASAQENLDLTLVDADGNEFAADDDQGAGEETITLTGGDLSALGDWTARVTHPQPSLNELDYQLTIEVVY